MSSEAPQPVYSRDGVPLAERPSVPAGAHQDRTVPERGRDGATLGELVARVSDQLGRILRGELQLIQLQLVAKGKNLGIGAALFVVAGLIAFFAAGVLIAAAVLGLAVVLPAWLSALIIGIAMLLFAGLLALIGKSRAQKGQMPSAAEAKAHLKEDVEAVKRGIKS